MNKPKTKYSFRAEVWKHRGPAAWCFATLPKKTSREIRSVFLSSEEGWGRLRTRATVGATSWTTALWFDTKSDAYLLPLKADVRKKERLTPGKTISLKLEFEWHHWGS